MVLFVVVVGGFVFDSHGGGCVVMAFWLWLLVVSVLPLLVNEAVTSHALHQQKINACCWCDKDELFKILHQMLI